MRVGLGYKNRKP